MSGYSLWCVGCLKDEKFTHADCMAGGYSLCLPCFKLVVETGEYIVPDNLKWVPTWEAQA